MGCHDNSCCFRACGPLGLLISLLFGILVGVLFFFSLIIEPGIFAWITFSIGILAFIILVTAAFISAVRPPNPLSKCLCSHAGCLLAGIFLTIITALFFTAGIADGITMLILLGINAFAFSLLIQGLIFFIICIVKNICSLRSGTQ